MLGPLALGLSGWQVILYGIPDIRYLWSSNGAVLNQFDYDSPSQFKPMHLEKPKSRDISFWTDPRDFDANHFFEVLRESSGDHVKEATLVA